MGQKLFKAAEMLRDKNKKIKTENLIIGELPVSVVWRAGQKNLYVRVSPPDGIVTVSAPLRLSRNIIKGFVLKKMSWIIKAREQMPALFPQSRQEYVSGETCWLWGRPYTLRVVYEGHRYKVEKTGDGFIMTVPAGTPQARRRKAMTEWYRAELKSVLPPMLRQYEERTGVRAGSCSVRDMRARWGSCNTGKKHILINLQLVKRPVECLEYVLIHELVHLIERNHTKIFYGLIEKYYPAWKDAKRILDSLPPA